MIKSREENGFCVHYSDAGRMIRKVGTEEIYEEARDLSPCKWSYEETLIPLSDYEQ